MNRMNYSHIVTWVAVFSLLIGLCSGLVINTSDTKIVSSGVIVGDKTLTSNGVIVGDDALQA